MLVQNTEDEVLKAAIAKYGKNQWCALPLSERSDFSNSDFSSQGPYIFITRPENSKAM
jgi:hypothetical protein